MFNLSSNKMFSFSRADERLRFSGAKKPAHGGLLCRGNPTIYAPSFSFNAGAMRAAIDSVQALSK